MCSLLPVKSCYTVMGQKVKIMPCMNIGYEGTVSQTQIMVLNLKLHTFIIDNVNCRDVDGD